VKIVKVGIVGIGHGKFGNRSDATVQELAFEPFKQAIEDAKNLRREDIDALVVGSVPEYHMQRSLPGVVAEYVGMNPKSVWLTEAACASGSAAIRTAYMAVKSGMHNIVAVIGVQKMRELPTDAILALMGRVGDVQWESIFGTTFPGYYAFYASSHMHKFGTTAEQMAQVAVKNHHYGTMNPNSFFQKEVTLERILKSEEVAFPLKVFDCCANADGAACVIMTNEKLAKKFSDNPIWFEGMGSASAEMSLLRRPNLYEIPSAVEAGKQAYKQAKVKPSDIQVAEVHDCFTIAEIMAYENLGFCEKGKGGKFIEEKQSYIGGKTPVNVDGGLKAKGHPVGATGVSMTVEIVKQLRGVAGKRQVKDAEIGLTHNVGGIGQYTFVNILRR
jgi:acetyl-CoA C-acetyltransferase